MGCASGVGALHLARKKQSQPFIPLTVTVGGIMVATKNATFEKPFFCGGGGAGRMEDGGWRRTKETQEERKERKQGSKKTIKQASKKARK